MSDRPNPPSRADFLRATGSTALAGLSLGSVAALAGPPAAALAAPASYPDFSWNRVPVGGEVGRRAGNYTPSEVAFLASHFSLLAIGPTAGMKDLPRDKQFGDLAFLNNNRLIKAANPRCKTIFHFAAGSTKKEYSAYANFDPAWTTPARSGGRPRNNLSNTQFRSWWTSTVADVVKQGGDGVFVDGIANKKFSPDKLALIQELREKLDATGKPALIILNGYPAPLPGDPQSLYNYADGVMIEQFDVLGHTSPDSDRDNLRRMVDLARAGKIVILKTWPTFNFMEDETKEQTAAGDYPKLAARARHDITFPLAAFLTAAQPYCYMSYAWGWSDEGGPVLFNPDLKTIDANWYPELLRPLGQPLGEATASGYQFTRRFERATVRVDLGTRPAAIDWS
jgi:hypothetical protein